MLNREDVHAWKGMLHTLKKCQMHNMPQKRVYLGMEWDIGNDMELNNTIQNFVHTNN
jgi:hypothetical protein